MYTRHGHHIPGSIADDDQPGVVARCGGVYLCEECREEVSLFHTIYRTPDNDDTHDPVNHPKHYTAHQSGVECIDITRHMNFNLGNAVKYLWRSGLKDQAPTVQDLEKAIWYIQDEIKKLKPVNNQTTN